MAVTLTDSYQYIGRGSTKTQNGSGTHYVLVYAKTVPNNTTGFHRVYVYTKMASNYGTFYGYDTTSRGYANGTQAFSVEDKPSSTWSGKNAIAADNAGGTKYSQSCDLGSGYVDVDCTDCKAKTIKVRGYYEFRSAGDTYTPAKGAKIDVSFDVNLAAINRQAKISSAQDFYDDEDPSITYTDPLSGTSSDYRLDACIAIHDGTQWTTTGAVPYRQITKGGGTYTFELTNEERQNLWDATSTVKTRKIAFFVQTTINPTATKPSTIRDYVEKTLTIRNADPSVSLILTEGNDKIRGLLGDKAGTTVVKGKSELTVATIDNFQKSAYFSQKVLTYGKATNTIKDADAEPVVFTDTSGELLTCILTDSRGNTSTATQKIEILPYRDIAIEASEFKRVSLDTNEVVLNATIACFIGNINNSENTFIIKYKGSNSKEGVIPSDSYRLYGEGENGYIKIENLSLGDNLVSEGEVPTFTLQVSDICSEENSPTTASNKIMLIVPTFEAGATEFRVNGSLVIADKKGQTAKEIRDLIYPVGSIYMSIGQKDGEGKIISPAQLFGGEWTRIQGQFLLAANDSAAAYNAGKTGGHTNFTIAAANLPSFSVESGGNTGWFEMRKSTADANEIQTSDGTVFKIASTSNSSTTITNSSTKYNRQRINFSAQHTHNYTGTNTAIDNMPPFLAVYVWKRTA